MFTATAWQSSFLSVRGHLQTTPPPPRGGTHTNLARQFNRRAGVHSVSWTQHPEHATSFENLRICLSHLPHQLASYHNSITALQQRIACVRACSAPLPMRPGTGRVRKKSVRPVLRVTVEVQRDDKQYGQSYIIR